MMKIDFICKVPGMTIEQERDQLREQSADMIAAIDAQMVSAHIGVFNVGSDPADAIKRLMDWSYGLGEYFAKEEDKQLREQVKLLLDALHDYKRNKDQWEFIKRVTKIIEAIAATEPTK